MQLYLTYMLPSRAMTTSVTTLLTASQDNKSLRLHGSQQTYMNTLENWLYIKQTKTFFFSTLSPPTSDLSLNNTLQQRIECLPTHPSSHHTQQNTHNL